MKDQREKLGRAWARLKSAHFSAVECLDGSGWQRDRSEELLKDAVDCYLDAFDACAAPPPPAPAPAPEPVPEPAPAEPKPQVIGTIEWGRWKPAETTRCACYRFWMSVVPPPPCPVHGQALPPQIWNSPFRPDYKK